MHPNAMSKTVQFYRAVAVIILILALLAYWLHDEIWGRDRRVSSKHGDALPSIVLMSVYMGGEKLHYKYFDLTLASMALNPKVNFLLIHVVKDDDALRAAESSGLVPYEVTIPRNFKVHRLTYAQLSALASTRLKIEVDFSEEWSYKMAEFKPTYGQLFEELLVDPSTGLPCDWWGYADLDLVWGNMTHFAKLFHSPHVYPIVHSGWRAPRGMAAFFINEPWTRHLYREDPIFLELLQNSSIYRNLDENGISCPPQNVVDEGKHSLAYFQWSALERRGLNEKVYGGKSSKDRLFIERIDSVSWAGPAVWQAGSLRTVREFSSAEDNFPPYRELMFYHRADDEFEPPRGVPRTAWVADMLRHGYLLPYFTPLLSRFICPRTASQGAYHQSGGSVKELGKYRPFDPQCFNKPNRNPEQKTE